MGCRTDVWVAVGSRITQATPATNIAHPLDLLRCLVRNTASSVHCYCCSSGERSLGGCSFPLVNRGRGVRGDARHARSVIQKQGAEGTRRSPCLLVDTGCSGKHYLPSQTCMLLRHNTA
jgi:hypothetical protein